MTIIKGKERIKMKKIKGVINVVTGVVKLGALRHEDLIPKDLIPCDRGAGWYGFSFLIQDDQQQGDQQQEVLVELQSKVNVSKPGTNADGEIIDVETREQIAKLLQGVFDSDLPLQLQFVPASSQSQELDNL